MAVSPPEEQADGHGVMEASLGDYEDEEEGVEEKAQGPMQVEQRALFPRTHLVNQDENTHSWKRTLPYRSNP